MPINITDEQRIALLLHPDGVKCEDEQSQRVYIIMEEAIHTKAMDALRRQDDLNAIAEGVADMQAGRGMPVVEADEHLRKRLGFPPRHAS